MNPSTPSARRAAAPLLAALLIATSTFASAPAHAQYKPTQAQLNALCSTCSIVTRTVVEKRKGKGSGVGAVGGAVVGGVVGRQIGDSGLATGAGAIAGGLLGNEIERRTKRHTVWVTLSVARDGQTHRYESGADPHFQPGDTLRVEQGQPVKIASVGR